MATDKTWEFEDCIVIEDIDSFEVIVTRNGVMGHQSVVPARMDECRKALDAGESPLWIWEDGAGVVVGEGMKASRQDLAALVMDSEYTGGETSTEGDQFQFITSDGYRLVVYTSESFPNDDATDREIIDTAESFAVVERSEGIPNRWDRTVLFEVE